MKFIFEPPANLILAALLSAVAVASAWRGTRLFFKGLRNPDLPSGPLWLVRGIRGWIVALAMSALEKSLIPRVLDGLKQNSENGGRTVPSGK